MFLLIYLAFFLALSIKFVLKVKGLWFAQNYRSPPIKYKQICWDPNTTFGKDLSHYQYYNYQSVSDSPILEYLQNLHFLFVINGIVLLM